MLEFYTQIIDAATFMSLPRFEGGKVGFSTALRSRGPAR